MPPQSLILFSSESKIYRARRKTLKVCDPSHVLYFYNALYAVDLICL